MIPLNFSAADKVPTSTVLGKIQTWKLGPGVFPMNYQFLRVRGTSYIIGVPEGVAKQLISEKDQTKLRKMMRPLVGAEVAAARANRPSPGKMLLIEQQGDAMRQVTTLQGAKEKKGQEKKAEAGDLRVVAALGALGGAVGGGRVAGLRGAMVGLPAGALGGLAGHVVDPGSWLVPNLASLAAGEAAGQLVRPPPNNEVPRPTGQEKKASLLPRFLAAPREEGWLDPQSDDFSKNQAFGHAVGVSLLPMAVAGGLGTQAAVERLWDGRGLLNAAGAGARAAALPAGLGLAAGGLTFHHSLARNREMQAQGLNPATGRPHTPEKYEKTRQWMRARMGLSPAPSPTGRPIPEPGSPEYGGPESPVHTMKETTASISSAMFGGALGAGAGAAAGRASSSDPEQKKSRTIKGAITGGVTGALLGQQTGKVLGNRRAAAETAQAGRNHVAWHKQQWGKLAEVMYRGKGFPGYNQPIDSDRAGKKKMVLAKKGDEVRLIHFGQKGYKHNYSEAAKKSYLARSAGIRGKGGTITANDPFSANYWARKELWPAGEADGRAASEKDAGLLTVAKSRAAAGDRFLARRVSARAAGDARRKAAMLRELIEGAAGAPSAPRIKEGALHKVAIGREMEIAGAAMQRLGLSGLGQRVTDLSREAPGHLYRAMMHEPSWQPQALMGKHIVPKPLLERVTNFVAHEPVLGAVMAAPTGPPGPLTYLGLRELAGRAVGLPGMGKPLLASAAGQQALPLAKAAGAPAPPKPPGSISAHLSSAGQPKSTSQGGGVLALRDRMREQHVGQSARQNSVLASGAEGNVWTQKAAALGGIAGAFGGAQGGSEHGMLSSGLGALVGHLVGDYVLPLVEEAILSAGPDFRPLAKPAALLASGVAGEISGRVVGGILQPHEPQETDA